MQVLCAGKHAQVNVLGVDVGKDDAGNDNGGQRDAPGDLFHNLAGAAEGGAGHVDAGVAVDDKRDNGVDDDLHELLGAEGDGEVLGVAQLRDEAHPGDVAGVGKDGVADGVEGRREVGAVDGLHVLVGRLGRHGQSNDGDEHGRHDADETDNAQKGDVLERPGNGEEGKDDEAHDAKDDGARPVVGQDVERNGKGQQVTGHEEEAVNNIGCTEDFIAQAPSQDSAHIGVTGDLRVSHTELPQNVTRVTGKDTQSDDGNQAGHKSDGCDHSGQGQDTQRDVFSNHDY